MELGPDEHSELDSNDELSQNIYDYDYDYSDDDIDYKIEDKNITAAFQRMCLDIDSVKLVTGCGEQKIHYLIPSTLFEMESDRLTALNINGLVSIWLKYEQNLDELKVLKVNCLEKGDENERYHVVAREFIRQIC